MAPVWLPRIWTLCCWQASAWLHPHTLISLSNHGRPHGASRQRGDTPLRPGKTEHYHLTSADQPPSSRKRNDSLPETCPNTFRASGECGASCFNQFQHIVIRPARCSTYCGSPVGIRQYLILPKGEGPCNFRVSAERRSCYGFSRCVSFAHISSFLCTLLVHHPPPGPADAGLSGWLEPLISSGSWDRPGSSPGPQRPETNPLWTRGARATGSIGHARSQSRRRDPGRIRREPPGRGGVLYGLG